MARYGLSADRNQAEIVEALRYAGATVESLHRVGAGVPDLLVGFRGRNYLLEIKDGKKVPSAQKLTEDQVYFHATWRGQVAVVRSVPDAFATIGLVIDAT